MVVVTIWFQKHPYIKGHGSNVGIFSFVKWYVDETIVFSLTPKDHMQHLQEVFKRLQKKITLSCIWAIAKFSKLKLSTWVR